MRNKLSRKLWNEYLSCDNVQEATEILRAFSIQEDIEYDERLSTLNKETLYLIHKHY